MYHCSWHIIWSPDKLLLSQALGDVVAGIVLDQHASELHAYSRAYHYLPEFGGQKSFGLCIIVLHLCVQEIC